MQAAEILAGGARLVRTQPKAVAIWGVLYVVAMAVTLAMTFPMFADLAAFQQQALAAQAAQLPPPPPPAGFFGAIFALDAVLSVLMVAIFAAAVRAVARGGNDAFGFLRFGLDELRLIGLGIILFVVFFVGSIILGIVFGIVVMIVFSAIGTTGGNVNGAAGAGILTLFVILGLTAAAVWLEVRLSLAGALTVLRGRIVIREAWRATRGRFWTLFGVYLLIGFVHVVATVALLSITNPGLFAAYAGGMRPEAMQTVLAQQQAMYADPFAPRMVAMWLLGAVMMAVGLAFTFGAIATAAIGFDRADQAAPPGD